MQWCQYYWMYLIIWGVNFVHLPTYSPEFNPCEFVFAEVKNSMGDADVTTHHQFHSHIVQAFAAVPYKSVCQLLPVLYITHVQPINENLEEIDWLNLIWYPLTNNVKFSKATLCQFYHEQCLFWWVNWCRVLSLPKPALQNQLHWSSANVLFSSLLFTCPPKVGNTCVCCSIYGVASREPCDTSVQCTVTQTRHCIPKSLLVMLFVLVGIGVRHYILC